MTEQARAQRTAIQRTAYARLGNSIEAQLIAAIWWWSPYAKAKRDGEVWVVKTDQDFIDQDGITAQPRAIRSAIASLKKKGWIATTRGPHPNGRAPNSRYLRLENGLAALLEREAPCGRKRRGNVRSEQDETAHSTRPSVPNQHGVECRFHMQGDGIKHSAHHSKKEMKRRSMPRSQRSSSDELSSEAFQVDPELLQLQTNFDAGCFERGWSAPSINHPERIRRLRKFWEECQLKGIPINLACEIIKRFAITYDPHDIAKYLARPEEKVSPEPNHFTLSFCSDRAIGAYREAVLEREMQRMPVVPKKIEERQEVRQKLLRCWIDIACNDPLPEPKVGFGW